MECVVKVSKEDIKLLVEIVFDAGKWVGQVELEEHMDKEQYTVAILECLQAKKTSMPSEKASVGRDVKYTLRSDKWREGVVKSSNKYKDISIDMIMKLIERKQNEMS